MRAFSCRALCSLLLGLYGIALGQGVPRSPSQKGVISLDVQQADVHEILRLIADVGQVNILVSNDVQGSLTLRLSEVPWEKALEAVLKLTGLGKERQDNVILVAPLERFRMQAEQRQRKQRVGAQTAPVITRVIQLNYANATTLQTSLATLLGACATISVDVRTNSLILSGTPACLQPAQGLH